MTWAAEEPNQFRRGLVQAFVAGSVIIPLLNFVQVATPQYSYGEQTTLGNIDFRDFNDLYESDAGIVNPKIENLALFGGTIRIDHQLEASPTHVNAVMAKMKGAGLFYDYMFINGDTTTNHKSFAGLKARVGVPQTLYAGDNGGPLTLALLDQLMDKVVGPNSTKVLAMSKYQKRAFKALVVAAAHGATVADVTNSLDTYDGAKIQVMDEDDVPQTVLPQTETRGSSNVTGSIYCFRPGKDPEGEYVQGLVRGGMIVHKPLALFNTQIGDLVEMFGGLGVFHGRAAARLAGLT
jgi:hypothetical protein